MTRGLDRWRTVPSCATWRSPVVRSAAPVALRAAPVADPARPASDPTSDRRRPAPTGRRGGQHPVGSPHPAGCLHVRRSRTSHVARHLWQAGRHDGRDPAQRRAHPDRAGPVQGDQLTRRRDVLRHRGRGPRLHADRAAPRRDRRVQRARRRGDHPQAHVEHDLRRARGGSQGPRRARQPPHGPPGLLRGGVPRRTRRRRRARARAGRSRCRATGSARCRARSSWARRSPTTTGSRTATQPTVTFSMVTACWARRRRPGARRRCPRRRSRR